MNTISSHSVPCAVYLAGGSCSVCARAEIALSMETAAEIHYFTVLIPWIEPKLATPWHPTSKTGPFAILSRGAFDTIDEAHGWAKDHLEGAHYGIIEVGYSEERGDWFNVVVPLSGDKSSAAFVAKEAA